MPLGFVNLGTKELILLLIIVLVIFGPRKIPEIGKSIGEMLFNIKNSSKESELQTQDKPSNLGTEKKNDSK